MIEEAKGNAMGIAQLITDRAIEIYYDPMYQNSPILLEYLERLCSTGDLEDFAGILLRLPGDVAQEIGLRELKSKFSNQYIRPETVLFLIKKEADKQREREVMVAASGSGGIYDEPA